MLAFALLGACSANADPNQVPSKMAKLQPSDGLVELRKLFAAGHVRAATQADIDAYHRIAQQVQPNGSQPLYLPMLIPDYTLVLIRPFKATPKMGEMTARQIIVPVGVGKNDDPNPLFGYYELATGRCNLPGTNCLGAPKVNEAWHSRSRRLSGMEPDNAALSEGEREDGNWAEGSKKDNTPEPSNGMLGQLPLD